MARIKLLVSVDRTKDAHRIAAELRTAGLEVTSEHPRLGVIAGAADEGMLRRLRHVRGVLSVERELDFYLAPPTSPIQ
jgi:hypothetical protein